MTDLNVFSDNMEISSTTVVSGHFLVLMGRENLGTEGEHYYQNIEHVTEAGCEED